MASPRPSSPRPWASRLGGYPRSSAARSIDAIARYIDALGGRLSLVVSFGDHTLTVVATEAA
jgi:hypothetical protein